MFIGHGLHEATGVEEVTWVQPELGGEFGSIERTEPCEPGLVGLRRERYLGARPWRRPATMR